MRKVVLAIFAASMMVTGTIASAFPGSAAPPEQSQAGRILVKFRDNGAAADVLRRYGLGEGAEIGGTGTREFSVSASRESQLIAALSNNPAVEYAEPDHVVYAASADPLFDYQYALKNVGQSFPNNNPDYPINVPGGTPDADVDADEAWNITTGNGIKVAVLDSGVDGNHEDISPKVVARANFSSSSTRTGDVIAEDYYGHGTHVAGIVAASTDNSRGVAGVCPGCTILAGKVLNDSGVGTSSSVANGINWAVNNGAKVINMSIGAQASRTLEAAVNKAWSKGVVLVAAAGNGGNQARIYPGAYSNVIAVGATDNNDAKAAFSTYGSSWVDIAAPGVNVYSTFPNHPYALAGPNNRALSYDVGNGTSMSSPIVAAVAAMVWSLHPGATATSVREQVESSGEVKNGMETLWKHGRVNAYNAVS
ncbi:S8 family serine peptidase [Arthrobacter sp. MPF02]|uniref:S8 family serine peptidase n=1 Tax=Arthrobacter sp. MPF02 TaxID=3388492 RepID=UPI00398503D1